MKVRKSFSMPESVATVIESAAKNRFGDNQSDALVSMVTFWKKHDLAKKRENFIRTDALVAQAIAAAKTDPQFSRKQARKKLLAFADEVAAKVRAEGNLETEDEIVESINLMRKERKDAFSSSS